jgi:hypothetical protein
MTTKKKMRHPSEWTKKVLSLIDEYETATGDKSGDLMKVAKWLRDHDKMDPPKYDPIKALAKVLPDGRHQPGLRSASTSDSICAAVCP